MRSFLITGVTGFLGTHLMRRLLVDEGYKDYGFVVLARDSNGRSARQRIEKVLMGYDLGRVEVVVGDIEKKNLGIGEEKIEELREGVCRVYHLAGNIDMSWGARERVWRANVDGTRNVLNFASGVKNLELVLDTSTAYVAGTERGVAYEDELYGRSGFNNPYEQSKFEGERIAREYIRDGFPVIVVRPSIVVGDSKTGEISGFDMVYGPWRAAKVAKDIFVRKNGENMNKDGRIEVPVRMQGRDSSRMNIIPVDYVVDMMARLAQNKENIGKIFHLTNPAYTTLGFLRDAICDYLGIIGLRAVDKLTLGEELAEKLFHRGSRVFLPYMREDGPIFDMTNTRRALGDEYVDSIPKPDERLMKVLIEYCDSKKWDIRPV